MINSGVYEIVNTVDGKRYIGSAVNLHKRKLQHFRELKKGIHNNQKLQRAYNKYGHNNFSFKEIVNCEPKNVVQWEQNAIDALEPEYNICKIAASTFGYRFSDEQKKKISESLLGKPISKPRSKEYRKKQSLVQTGKKRTEEQKKQMSERQKNKPPISEETREKLRIARKGRKPALGMRVSEEHKNILSLKFTGEGNPFFGKKHSEETINKIKAARNKKRKFLGDIDG